MKNIGASIVKEVSSKTNDAAGDGTTTATVLAQAIINNGLKLVAAGVNPIEIRKGIESRVAQIVEALKKMSKSISTKEEIARVGLSPPTTEKSVKLLPRRWIVSVKKAWSPLKKASLFGIEKEVVEGMQFDKGYVSPYMISNQETMKAEMTDPYILVTDKKIASCRKFYRF